MAALRAHCVAWLLCLLGAARGHGFYHLDLEVNYDSALGWSFSIFDLNYGRLKLEENPVLIPHWGLVRIPPVSDPHSLYGRAERYVWLIPESPVLGLPFLGFSAEGIPRGIFVNNWIETSVDGLEWVLLTEVLPVQPRVPVASIDRTSPLALFRAAILVP